MESVNDLIQEAKLRTLWWALCIFAVSYFLTHTSKSMWMNLPMSIIFVAGLRILFNRVEFRWKVQEPKPLTYLSHLEKKQLSLKDSRLTSLPPPAKWKRKIDSPAVEAAMREFIDKILKDFVVDLWYSDITPDKEFPEQIRAIIMDVLAEISGRVKEINLVDLLTRDVVDLIGDHLELFRRNQAAIGVDVMKTLSSEERDDRLKFHLLNSKELHPALISPESEYKVLQQLMSAVLATVLRQREAQCPVIRSIARELLTCLVMQPIMNLASPGYINELIEALILLLNDDGTEGMGSNQSTNVAGHHHGHSVVSEGGHNNLTPSNKNPSLNQGTEMILAKTSDQGGTSLQGNNLHQESSQARPADWARMLEVATQRRTEILMPENLENMWTKGRNYKRKENKIIKVGFQDLPAKSPSTDSLPPRKLAQETSASKRGKYEDAEGNSPLPKFNALGSDPLQNVATAKISESSQNPEKELSFAKDLATDGYESPLKRSNSASSLGILTNKGGSIISEFYNPELERHSEGFRGKSSSDMVVRKERPLVSKLRCRVLGAYFEKIGSTCFAVYSIAVTDAQNKTWFVKRRFRNFERLHRHLKDIPNYTLHLPPKRIFSSNTDDAFVHQRCVQLDKYLQDLLSIANVAEQHEVWDFFSVTSKNYSFGKSPSVMKTLAVNVDDAMDDIVRQFKGVSDGLRRKVVGSSSLMSEGSVTSSTTWNLSLNSDEIDKIIPRQGTSESVLSSDEEGEKNNNFDDENIVSEVAQVSGLHFDNALILKGYSSPLNNRDEESNNLDFDRKHDMVVEARVGNDVPATNFILIPDNLEDPVGGPPEWSPPNVSVPILDLVDNIFQLKKRGWIRRQVYWMSKQILQLVMEDAIDDWLLRQIHWLRREETVAQGIRGIVLVGVAGPSGAGKTVFTEKILNFMPSIAVISMDNYNDSSRIVDGNFDDPRLTDYDTLLQNLGDLKEGKPVQVPIYDFKSSTRTGYRTVEAPTSRIVFIEGIYALSEKLRPLLDLRVSVTGGVHLDLVKRVIRDIQRAGQEPEEIIHQISETVYPMYKAFIEPDLQTAHIKIINKFNPFTGFQSPTYILKSAKNLAVDQIKAVLSEDFKETTEQTYDIYLLPPGEDPETCQSYLRMRNKDGKYSLMFEEWVTDNPFVISPRITFEVSVRLLGGLMALGYTIATILKRNSHVFSDDRVCVKLDWLEQLNRHYVQVQGRDRLVLKYIGQQLGLDGSYIPRTYIEQIQIEKLVDEVMALPDDLKTKLSLDEDLVSSPKEALSRASADRVAMRNKHLRSGISQSYTNQRDKNLAKVGFDGNNRRFGERNSESSTMSVNQGAINQLSDQISALNDRMDEFTNRIEELNSKLNIKRNSPTQQNMSLQAETCNGSAPTSYFITGLGNGSLTGSKMANSSSSSQLTKDFPLMDEISSIARSQRQIMHQLDNLNNLLRGNSGEKSQQTRTNRRSIDTASDSMGTSVMAVVAVGCLGIFLMKGLLNRN